MFFFIIAYFVREGTMCKTLIDSTVVFRLKQGVRNSKFLAYIENLAEIKHCLT